MKNIFIKIYSFIVVLLFAFVLIGCGESNNEKDLLQSYYDALTIESVVEKNFELPYSVNNENNHYITWTSSDKNVLSISEYSDGVSYLVTVKNKEEDVKVIVIASIKLESGLSIDKQFEITVKGIPNSQDGGEGNQENIKDKYECISIYDAIEIAKASGETGSVEKYYIYGIIKSVSNPTYGEMTITDGENELYVYGTMDENEVLYGSWTTDKPVAGDEVVLYGNLKMFNEAPEMGRSIIKAFNHIIPEVDEKEYVAMSIAEARETASGTKMKLTGIVSTITNAFGYVPNGFYLIDETGSIYVYGGDVAQQVSVGNKVTIAAEKTYYINPDELNSAEKYNYEGALQVQKPILLSNDKGKNDFNKSWIKETTVKEIIETGMETNITSDLFKVNAFINKVPGSGFTNYYINDLDGKTGSYVYTMCNGNDFTWLDQYDGKICTIYLSPINCKATAAGTIYRFIPVLVEDNGFVFDVKDACEHAIKYYAIDQFKSLYQNNPALKVITSVSSSILGFENVALNYTSNNTNVVFFENNVMNTKDNGEAIVTITATYGEYSYTAEVSIKVEAADVSDFMNVASAVATEDGTIVKVKGIVVASLVNQTGFYLGDETGIIAITCSGETLSEVELGQEIVIEGTRTHRKKDAAGAYAGQSEITDAKLVVNYYGQHEYSKESFITDKTLKDIYELDYTVDHTTEVYVVKGIVEITESNYYSTISVKSEDGSTSLMLYCSSAKQYNWLKEFAGQVVTLEIAPVNWNGKNYYRGCVISATDGDKTLINNLNFAN